jgi:serine/threonine protein kinase
MEHIVLLDYCDYEFIEEEHVFGLVTFRAHVVGHHHKRVRIKAMTFYSEEESELLTLESELLQQLNDFRPEYEKLFQKKDEKRRGSFLSQPVPMMNLNIVRDDAVNLFGLPVKSNAPDHVPNFISLQKHNIEGCQSLVVEDFEGVSLLNYFPNLSDKAESSLDLTSIKKLELTEKIDLFIQFTEVLNYIHSAKICHLQFCPANILVKFEDGKKPCVQLINFRNGSTFEQLPLVSVKPFANLSYISPELTGRTNCLVDYRSDMYSCGVMMWEILTEEKAFKDQDEAVFHF